MSYWYCHKCESTVPNIRVKFDETHEGCGNRLEVLDSKSITEELALLKEKLKIAEEALAELAELNLGVHFRCSFPDNKVTQWDATITNPAKAALEAIRGRKDKEK